MNLSRTGSGALGVLSVPVLVPMMWAGCGPSGREDGSPVGVHQAPIVRERAEVKLVSRYRRTDPVITLASYAMVELRGCSGTMIGPRILMSAAHCGTAPKTIWFRVYDQSDETASTTETFTCRYLIATHPDSDLALFYCDPNSSGELPGEKYGYLDFDIVADANRQFDYSASKAKLTNGTFVQSIWWNPVGGIPDAMLYSSGQFRLVDENRPWYAPSGGFHDCANPGSMQLDAPSNLWSAHGASGSSLFSSGAKILAGPTSSVPGGGEGADRGALSIADYLMWGFISFPDTIPCGIPTSDPQVNSALISSLGLTPANYSAWVDEELDGAFDIQTDIEAIQNETARDVYWLGFESHRRNLQWTVTGHGTAAFPTGSSGLAAPYVTLTRPATPTGLRDVLVRSRLNLSPGVVYRIKYNVNVLSTTNPKPLGFCAGDRCIFPTLTTGSLLSKSEYLVAGAGGGFAIRVRESTSLQLSAIQIVRDGRSFDFDSHDQRAAWKDSTTFVPFIWPVGHTGASPPATATGAGSGGTGASTVTEGGAGSGGTGGSPVTEGGAGSGGTGAFAGSGGVGGGGSGGTGGADWAGAVRRTGTNPPALHWSLSGQLAFVPGKPCTTSPCPTGPNISRVCFKTRHGPIETIDGAGTFRIVDSSGVWPGSNFDFTPTSTWTQVCSGWFEVRSGDARADFGTRRTGPGAPNTGYLIDDVVVERDP